MGAIEQLFKKQQHSFVGFVTGGDGGIDYCVECCLQLLAGGVDMLEIGFPFSDPVADGPVIQRSSQRALEQGSNSTTMLEIGARLRKKTDAPLILFSYYNPLLKRGSGYLKLLKSAGYDAILAVDLPSPADQSPHPYFDLLKQAGLHPIFMATPSTDEQRLAHIARIAEGFVYYACQRGTTGVRAQLPDDFPMQIARIRQKTTLPIAAGFGIADRASAQAALKAADAFVVGSAFVKLMENQADPGELKRFAEAIDPRRNSSPKERPA